MADAIQAPVVASGGIVDGRGLAAALALGAEAFQIRTAFLTCLESGTHPEYKKAVLEASGDATKVTRTFSGKPARAIKNRFLSKMEEHEDEIPLYPVQNAWTEDIRDTAKEQSRSEFMSLWSGQSASLSRSIPAAEVVQSVVDASSPTLR